MRIWVGGGDAGNESEPGDVVIRPTGATAVVCLVTPEGQLGESVEVNTDLLPGLPRDAVRGWQECDDEALRRAVNGIITAEYNRGG